MRSAYFAEWILSLVTDPARAASTVGDLVEESRSHGPLWFWSAVSWTALSLLVRDLTSHPRRMARLAGLGMLGIIIEVSAAAVIGLSAVAVTSAAMMLAGPMGLSLPSSQAYAVLGYVMFLPIQFQIGGWLARRAPGHELPACAAMTLLSSFIGLVVDRLMGTPLAQQALNLTVYQSGSVIPLVAGAILVRRRRQSL